MGKNHRQKKIRRENARWLCGILFVFIGLICGATLCLLLSGCAESRITSPDTTAEPAPTELTETSQAEAMTLPDAEVRVSDDEQDTDAPATEYLTLGEESLPTEPGNRLGYVPTLYIKTEKRASVTSDTESVAFTMDVKRDGETAQTGLTGQIVLRGNGSLNMEKKSYTLTFDEKQDPVGSRQGKNRNWVLISNHCDKSLLRNYIAFWMQEKIGGITWSPWACTVELYINGRYVGTYLLAEKVTCGGNRLNIDNQTGGINADFLVEMDNYASDTGEKGVTWFTAHSIPYAVRGEDSITRKRCDAIDARITSAYDTVCAGNEQDICELMDISSVVDSYIIEEVTKNIDCGWSSFFLYFKDGKLHMGPLWDFDLAMGNDQRLDNGSYRRLYAGEDRGFKQTNMWYVQLMKQDWFVSLVNERWRELYNGGFFDRMQEEITSTETVCHDSFTRNFRKWPVFTTRISQEPDSLLKSSKASSEAQVDALSDWLRNRVNWLNENGFD